MWTIPVEAKDGIYKENGVYYYYKTNYIATDITDVVRDSKTGKWYNVVKGKVVGGPTAARNTSGWWYVKNGKLNLSYNGLAKHSGSWWYIKNGKVNSSYNGTVKYNGKTFKVKNGKVVF